MPFYCDTKFTDAQRKLLPNQDALKVDILFCHSQAEVLQNELKDAVLSNPSTYNALLWVQEYWISKRDASRRLLRETMITEATAWAWWEYDCELPQYGMAISNRKKIDKWA